MKLSRADIAPIADGSAYDFSAWLQAGFEDIASGNPTRIGKAFKPVHLAVIGRQALADDLELIYDALDDAAAQREFRIGLAIAFDRLAVQATKTEALRTILTLAQRVNAAELIERIVPMLTNTGSCHHDPALFRSAFDYLAMMAPLPGAKVPILSLVASQHFNPAFSVYAFLSLCRCEPSAWIDHLSRLRHFIAVARDGKRNNNTLLTAKRFLALVPLTYVADNILFLNYELYKPYSHQADNWLAEALFAHPGSPLTIVDAGDGWLNIAKSDDSTAVRISDVRNPKPGIVRFLARILSESLSTQALLQRLQVFESSTIPDQKQRYDKYAPSVLAWAEFARTRVLSEQLQLAS